MSRKKKSLDPFTCRHLCLKRSRKHLYDVHLSCTARLSAAGCFADCKVATGKAMKCTSYEREA